MKKRLLLGLPLIGIALLTIACNGQDNPSVSSTTEVSSTTSVPTTVPTNTTVEPTTTTPVSNALSRISLNSDNMKKSYYIGEKLDLTGLVVKARYEDGTEKEVTNYTYDENTFDSSVKGVCFVKIIYTENGVTKTRNVQVDVISLLDDRVYLIGLTCSGAKTEYKYQEQLDISNLKVVAYYSDDSTKEISSNDYEIDTTAFNSNMRGNYEIVVKYKEVYSAEGTSITATKEAETCFFANVILNMENISFESGTSVYYQYGGVSTNDWKIKVTYKEGVSEVISKGFTTNIDSIFTDSTVAGSQNITISYSYNGVTCTTTRRCTIRPVKQVALFGALDTKNEIQNEDYAIDSTFTLLKGYKVIENRQECDDQIYSKCIALDGVGSRDENAIKLNLTNIGRIQICVSSEEGTAFGLYDANGDAVFTNIAPNEVTRYMISGLSNGTYYLWSEGGLNIFYIGTFE